VLTIKLRMNIALLSDFTHKLLVYDTSL